jgi:hypothetical protein
MLALAPEPEAVARSSASGTAGALIGGGAADFLDEKGVNAAAGIESRDAGQAAVDDDPDAVDGERRFGDVRRNNGPSLLIMGERGVLLRWRQFPVQREDDKTIAHARGSDSSNGAPDLVFAWHEDEDVAFGARGEPLELIGGEVPDGIAIAADRFGKIFDFDRKLSTARGEEDARIQIFLEQAGIEGRGHDG